METLQKVCLVITIVGAVAWGIIGLFNLNIIEALFGMESFFPRVIYTLVGVTGLINIGILFEHLHD